MHRLFLLVSALLALGSVVAAAADDKDTCRRSNDILYRTNVCERAIDSGQYRGYDLADLHQRRAHGLISLARPVDQNTTKRYDNAIASLGEAIRIVLAEGGTDRNRLREAYYWRAYAFIEKKEFEPAIADLNEAIKHKPADASAFFLRGEAHLGKGEADRAIADFGDAIRLDTRRALAHSTAYENRALAYEMKGEIDKALAEARRADTAAKAQRHLRPTELIKRLEQKLAAAPAPAPKAAAPAKPIPAPAIAAANDREKCRSLSSFDEAIIAACTRTIQIDPKESTNYFNRGLSYHFKNKDYDRAIADFSEGIRLDPQYYAYFNHRGMAYYEKRDYDRAIADLSEAISLFPKYELALTYRGLSYKQKGDMERAVADLRRTLELDPKQSEAKQALAEIEAAGKVAKVPAATVTPAPQKKEAAASPSPAPTPTPAPTPAPAPARDEIAWDFMKTTTDVAALRRFVTEFPNSARKRDAEARIATLLREEEARKAAAVIAPRVEPAKPPAAKPVLPDDPGRRVALVIGNSRYRHATVLPNPGNDATDLAKALRELGFEVIEGRDLDWAGIHAKVKEFARKLDDATMALFFYAGHGVQIDGRNYLVPVDAKLDRAGTLDQDAVDLLAVLRPMEAEKRVNLVFLDACRDNPFTRSLARSLGATRSTAVGQGLAAIQRASGTLITYATEPGNVAADGDGRNSPFTAALLKHIGKPGLEIEQMMKLVRLDVMRATREKQLPKTDSGLLTEVFLKRPAQ